MVCPFGWVCQAVRAPGVKCTLLACMREGPDGAATASMNTAPVNQSLGPGVVSVELVVISTTSPLARVGPVLGLALPKKPQPERACVPEAQAATRRDLRRGPARGAEPP